jgi:hypothetical protein
MKSPRWQKPVHGGKTRGWMVADTADQFGSERPGLFIEIEVMCQKPGGLDGLGRSLPVGPKVPHDGIEAGEKAGKTPAQSPFYRIAMGVDLYQAPKAKGAGRT